MKKQTMNVNEKKCGYIFKGWVRPIVWKYGCFGGHFCLFWAITDCKILFFRLHFPHIRGKRGRKKRVENSHLIIVFIL